MASSFRLGPTLWSFAVLFCVVRSSSVPASDKCKNNFFGPRPDCLRCHCFYASTCDKNRGTCLSRGCANGFGGSSCQYKNLASGRKPVAYFPLLGSNETLSQLVDGDRTTCILEQEGVSNKPLAIDFPGSFWVDVITIILFRPSGVTSNNLSVVYYHGYNASGSLQPHLAGPNDTLMTYHLPRPAKVSRLEIRGIDNLPLGLCEVSVLAGRNLAVLKPTTQGDATYTNNGISYGPERAVDGDTDGKFTEGSCTHTDGGARNYWTVALGEAVNIWRISVYNRKDSYSERLSGFGVNVTLRNGSEVHLYRNDKTTPRRSTTIRLDQPLSLVTNVTVYHDERHKILTLCEVEVFGDCENGYYGWRCDRKCQCKDPSEICDKVWGYCPHSGCPAGFRGDSCHLDCFPGNYGQACAKNCSSFCANGTCDHVTGNCVSGCLPGYEEPRCDKVCGRGSYGEGCMSRCPVGCQDALCHPSTGDCSNACLPGLLGPRCDTLCDGGFHGDNCSLTCSSNCLNNSCDATSGECLAGCQPGLIGRMCDKQASVSVADGHPSPVVWIVVGGVCLLLLLVVIAVVVCRRRRRKPKPSVSRGKLRAKADNENSTAMLLTNVAPSQSRGEEEEKEKEEEEERKESVAVSIDQYAVPHKDRAPTSDNGPHSTTTPSPKPRTQKPQLLSLFSRDASQTSGPIAAAAAMADQGQFPPVDEEGKVKPAAPRREGLQVSSSVQSSPRSQRAVTPTLARKAASLASLDTLSMDAMDVGLAATPPLVRRTVDGGGGVGGDGGGGGGGDSDYYNVTCRDVSPTTAIPLRDLPAKLAQWLENPRHFSKEKAMLPAGKVADWKIAMAPENARKNRYKDIYPYDHSRVQLTPLPNDPFSDYYNACYVDGYETEKEYIAAQGPMERTLSDFLRLVWDVKCSRIVMLTNVVELGRFKCQQYWPEEKKLKAGDITVRLSAVTEYADYCIRTLLFKRGGEKRTVTMYHYTAWPDNSAPASPWSLLDFRLKVHQGASTDEGPVIVHCSAGIGRTGTFLAVDILLSRAQRHPDVDVYACVWKLRQHRVHMVQTLAQYIFIHETISATLMTSLPVPVKEFSLERLLAGGEKEKPIDKEFEQLQMCLGALRPGESKDATPPALLGLPRDLHRVHIASVDGSTNPAYINAVFLSNYSQADAYVQTHTPTDEGGAVNFLSVLIQYNVTSVVCLDPDQMGVYRMWPESTETIVTLGPFTVALLSMRKERNKTVRNLRVTFPWNEHDTSQGGDSEDYSVEVSHVTCDVWPLSRCIPPSVSVLLELMEAARPQDDGSVVVYCRDGHSRSGLFCVAAAVLERMRAEGHVAVNYVTAHMRVPRRENIVNLKQYEFLYRCAQHQLTVGGGGDSNSTRGRPGQQPSSPEDSQPDENMYGNLDTISPALDDAATAATADVAAATAAAAAADADDSQTPVENLYGNIGALPRTAVESVDTPAVGASNASSSADQENTYAPMQSPTATKDHGVVWKDHGVVPDEEDGKDRTYFDMNSLSKTKRRDDQSREGPAYGNTHGNVNVQPPTVTAKISPPAAEAETVNDADAPSQAATHEEENLYGNIASPSGSESQERPTFN